jgi:hypothetical protein
MSYVQKRPNKAAEQRWSELIDALTDPGRETVIRLGGM